MKSIVLSVVAASLSFVNYSVTHADQPSSAKEPGAGSKITVPKALGERKPDKSTPERAYEIWEHFKNTGDCTIAAGWTVVTHNYGSGQDYPVTYDDPLAPGAATSSQGILKLVDGANYHIKVTGRCQGGVTETTLAEEEYPYVDYYHQPLLNLNGGSPIPPPAPQEPQGELVRPNMVAASGANQLVSDYNANIACNVGDWVELSFQYPNAASPKIQMKNDAPDNAALVSFKTLSRPDMRTAVAIFDAKKAGNAHPRLIVDGQSYVFTMLIYARTH